MALPNVNRPTGFDPVQLMGETAPELIPRPVLASRTPVGAAVSADLAIGDAYGIDANGNAYHAGADANVRGIVRGFRMQADSRVMGGGGPVSIDYLAAASAGTVLGIEDPAVLFEAQSDTFAVTNIGQPFNLADAAPDPTLRQSRQTINIGGGAGTQFRAIDIVRKPTDNAYGANARVRVRLLQSWLS